MIKNVLKRIVRKRSKRRLSTLVSPVGDLSMHDQVIYIYLLFLDRFPDSTPFKNLATNDITILDLSIDMITSEEFALTGFDIFSKEFSDRAIFLSKWINL